jgi:uncharacterized protein
MSEENVEVVRRAIDAYNRRDLTDVLAHIHGDIEWESGLLGTTPYRGRDGIRRMWEDVDIAWEAMKLVPRRFIDGGDVVVANCTLVAKGRTSGSPVEGPQIGVVDFEGGLIRRVRLFTDHAEALEAAGLSE